MHLNVTHLNDKIFITSSDQKLGISYDQGRTWALVANPGFVGNTGARYFAEGNGVIISVSYEEGTGQGNVSRSTDNGKTWTLFKMGRIWSPPIFYGSQFIAWSDGKTWFSSDGLSWSNVITKIDGQDAPSYWPTATAYNSKTGTFIAIRSGWNQVNENQKAYRSKDGINWTSLDATKFKGGNSVTRATIGEIETKYCP